MTEPHFARAFGLDWRSDTPLSLFTSSSAAGDDPDVVVERVAALPPRPGGQPVNNGELFADGIRFRFAGAAFDMFDGRLVRWCGPGRGLPLAFYGTVTGLLLAWRGLVPLHGSAVALGGGAVLIAGRSGAGKSTLCHTLVERGGLLVSDDLSALSPMRVDGVPLLQPGRSAIRLIDRGERADPGDKGLVTPAAVPPDLPVPLTHLILLQDTPAPPGPAAATAVLMRQQFRPRWMRALPGAPGRTATLFLVAQRIAIHVLPPATSAPELSSEHKAARVLELMARDRPMDSARPAA